MVNDSPAAGASPDVPRPLVLVVDDDADCRLIFGTALESAGFRVVSAEDGESGVAAARRYQPDVVLLDIAMPRLDGRAALRILREQSSARIPTIAITAMESAHTRGAFEKEDFDAVLLKPIEPRLVVTAVSLALARRSDAVDGHTA